MKIAGVLLLVLQVVSLIPSLASGDNIFENGIPNLLGRFIFAIIGVILLIIAKKKNKD